MASPEASVLRLFHLPDVLPPDAVGPGGQLPDLAQPIPTNVFPEHRWLKQDLIVQLHDGPVELRQCHMHRPERHVGKVPPGVIPAPDHEPVPVDREPRPWQRGERLQIHVVNAEGLHDGPAFGEPPAVPIRGDDDGRVTVDAAAPQYLHGVAIDRDVCPLVVQLQLFFKERFEPDDHGGEPDDLKARITSGFRAMKSALPYSRYCLSRPLRRFSPINARTRARSTRKSSSTM